MLDAFANRIGNNTWQTVITAEGLQAIKKLLRKTASKNTAVSCHWIRSRSRSELLWVVGNRDKFNGEGVVPVNYTKKDILKNYYENDWQYLPSITALTAIAALFHDWGKASEFFQARLQGESGLPKGDPLRHEWISLLFLNAFVNNEKDKQWLTRLQNGDFDEKYLIKKVAENIKKPMKGLPFMASLIGWLIVSHHRLPTIYKIGNNDNDRRGDESNDIKETLNRITKEWWYQNKFDEEEFDTNIKRCFEYDSDQLPNKSKQWLKNIKRYAGKLLLELHLLENISNDKLRYLLGYSRLSLMLGDHYYSSLDFNDKSRTNKQELKIYANTGKNAKTNEIQLKQTLDEHLVGVTKQAVKNTYLLQLFENKSNEMPTVDDNQELRRKSPKDYQWQDTVVDKIKKWRKSQEKLNTLNFGFFAVNMASTGTGKTFANAKVMRALSKDEKSLRYILALGLRTLTLQTGDEYRDRIKLEKDELGVLIGSTAILNLHNNTTLEDEEIESESGSDSEKTLLDNEFYFEANIPDDFLKTLFPNNKSKKNKKFLYAPVLSCTIDYLISATETKKGGRYILPILRLMSSDLVIDEIDDFDGDDLIAIGRLIHLAGMLGRKVMISSATVAPDLAEGYFNAYQSGWKIYADIKAEKSTIGCAWIDEFDNNISVKSIESKEYYQKQHNKFIKNRIDKLSVQVVKRKANIVAYDERDKNVDNFYHAIWQTILEKHKNHYTIQDSKKRKISFGVVRFANINPCIEFTRYLLNVELDSDTEIRTMAYHSAQLLIMRHAQEKHLDAILKRSKETNILNNLIIKNHLKNTSAKNIIFILVATPVEEVGRDHDFDWAVIEPSSYRSFIQLAGRVLRHRNNDNEPIKNPNVAIMQYNLRHIKNNDMGKAAFCWPGYESKEYLLTTHDINELVDTNQITQRIDAQPRISKSETLKHQNKLVDLEHYCIHKLLTNYQENGPESMQGWISGCWWLTGMPQRYVQFRKSAPESIRYLLPDGNLEDEWWFFEKDDNGKTVKNKDDINNGENNYDDLSDNEKQRLWLNRGYQKLLQKLTNDEDLKKIALIYGEINLPTYGNDDKEFSYSHHLGLSRK